MALKSKSWGIANVYPMVGGMPVWLEVALARWSHLENGSIAQGGRDTSAGNGWYSSRRIGFEGIA